MKKEKEKKVEVIYKKKYSRLTNEQNIHHREREERNKSHISKKQKHVLKNEKRKLRKGKREGLTSRKVVVVVTNCPKQKKTLMREGLVNRVVRA